MTSIFKTQHKISQLLELVRKNNIDSYMVSSSDEFQNEFPPSYNQRLKWLTSFTGSYGLIFISTSQSILFTDKRYFLEAQQHFLNIFQVSCINDYKQISNILKHLYIKIGYDPHIFNIQLIKKWRKVLLKTQKLIPIEKNLIDTIWHRPIITKTKAPILLNSKYTGIPLNKKIKFIIQNLDTDYLLITEPNSICWLLNLRGYDANHTPIVLCYCIIKNNGYIELFASLQKIRNHYNNLLLHPFIQYKKRFLEIITQGYKIKFSKQTPIWFLQQYHQVFLTNNLCRLLQSIKNTVETSGIIFAHRQDGVAFIKLIKWINQNFNNHITEIIVIEQLIKFKNLGNLYINESFPPIAAFGKNSAVIHYHPIKIKHLKIDCSNIFLLDSGSHYKTGTTDTTRTFCFGLPKHEHKKYYTLILKCLIKLTSLHFPKNTTGSQLDGIAREILWQHGLDYPHATGHGVGHYLSVHEGPISLQQNNILPLKENMIISIEPGLYFSRKYGMRIENLAIIRASHIKNFLTFKTLTKIPMSINLIDYNLIDSTEQKWLKDYHLNIYKELAPYLENKDKSLLKEICTHTIKINKKHTQ